MPEPINYSNKSTSKYNYGGDGIGSIKQPVVDSSDPSDTGAKVITTVTGDGAEEIVTNSPGTEVKDALDKDGNSLGFKAGAFNNDGRSDTKFQQRINKAESEGRYGKKQRLQNRHANFLKNQGERAVKNSGKPLPPKQQAKIDAAQNLAGGTKVGKFLREKPITGAVKDAGAFVKSLFK